MVPPESSPPTTAVAKRNRMITSRMMCPNLSGTAIVRLVMFNEYHELLVEITLECVAPHGWRPRDPQMAGSISAVDTLGSSRSAFEVN